jgi:hypothetical protein
MNMTLNELLADLEGLTKQAEEDPKKDEKDEKKEEGDAKKEFGKAKEDLKAAGKAVEKSEEDEEEEDEQCKEARFKGAELAKEVMSKVASLQVNNTPKKEGEMKKEAAAAGKALADALLEKLANAGDESTENGVAPGSVPQKIIVDNAQTVAEDNMKIKPMPTGNGIRNEGTINQILDGIVADAISQGATSYGQGVEAKAAPIDAVEGDPEHSATPNQVAEDDDEVEKAAAVSALVSDGFDFASAVEMVKAAAEEIEFEENTQIKQAALGALLDRGVDFDTAVAMVKRAGALVPVGGRALVAKGGQAVKGMGRAAKLGIAGAAGAVVGGGAALAAKRGQEKKAAVSALVDAGVDFDQAIVLVNAKAAQLYGY